MNTSASPPAAATNSECRASRAEERGARDDDACTAFASALQQRQRQSGSDDEAAPPPPGEPALLAAWPAPAPLGTAVLPPASPAGALDPAPSSTQAALQASLRDCGGPPAATLGNSDAASAWEVSVHEPNSVAVQVRAERSAASGPQPTWSLTVAAPAVAPEVLARHAPRLQERLRKHAIALDHVRVERHEGDES